MSNRKFIDKNQKNLKKIWESALDTIPRSHMLESDDEVSFVRRGYKISRTYIPDYGNYYELLETYSNDYYKWVKQTDYNLFKKKGFRRAVDELQVARNTKKIKHYSRKIESASSDRNDSLIVHWQRRRKELIEKNTLIQESFSDN